MSKQSLKTIIQEANERQEAKRIAAEKGMTLVELAQANGWKGEVQEFIGVLVSYGSLFDESFSEQLPSLEAHLAERGPESLMVMTEVVSTHLEAISREIEAGMYQPPSPVEEHADFGDLLAETAGASEVEEAEEAAPAEPLPDAAERAEALLDQFTAGSGGAEEAEDLLADLMDEESTEEEVSVSESEDLLAELMGEEAPEEVVEALSEEPAASEPVEAAPEEGVEDEEEALPADLLDELAQEEESAPEVEVEVEEPAAGPSVSEEALEDLLAAEEPSVDSEAFAAELEALAEMVEPEAVEAVEENNENVAAEAEEEAMSDLLGDDETLPDYLSSYLEAAEPSASEESEGDELEDLLADVVEAAEAAEAEPETEEPSLADLLESAEEALTELGDAAAADGSEAEFEPESEPEEEAISLVEEADAVDDMMAAMGSLMEEPIAEEPASAEEPEMVEAMEDVEAFAEESAAEEVPTDEEMPEMEALPPIDEVAAEPAAAPAAGGESVRVIAESFVVSRDGVELYRGDDKGDAAMVLREAFTEHGQEGLLLKRVVEREIVRTETQEVLMPFSFSVDIQID